MSELRSVIAFFLGLVFFVVIIGLAIGRIRLPKKDAKTTTVTELVTPTPKISPTKKPGLIDKIAGIFRRTTPTPKIAIKETIEPKIAIKETSTPVSEMKQALEPEKLDNVFVDRFPQTTKGGVQTIPESGAPTLLVPLAFVLTGIGTKLRRKK